MAAVGSQTVLQVGVGSHGVIAATELALLVAHAAPAVFAVRASQTVAQVSIRARGIPAASNVSMLVAFKTGAPENLKTRAWTFSLDGHTFYVVTLGEQGTFVYDLTTEEWAKWQTEGLNSWNMERGLTWRGRVLAADRQNAIIWRLTPTIFLDDDFKPQTRKVTGSLSMRQRTFVPNYAFRITASLGVPVVPLTIPETLPTVELRYSDDQGKTFISAGKLTLELDNFTQPLQWLSLGTMQPPQRVFEITDIGSVVRISGADAEVEEEEE